MPHVSDITASEHPVKGVTIFKTTIGFSFGAQPTSAEVVRSFPVKLMAGENVIKVHGLSSVIDTESVRVSGLPSGVSLFDIVSKLASPKPLEPDSVEEEIRALSTKKEALNSEKRVRGHEADILVQYGKSLSGEHVSPEMATTFLDAFVSNGKRNIESITKLDEEIVKIDRQVAQIRERQSEKVGRAQAQVSVTLAAREQISFELKLTYRTRNVSWTANYDLHAATEAGQPTASVNLHYRAKIYQSTGEDWKDTALTLSTATADSYSKGLPALKLLRITPVNAQQKAYYASNNNTGGPFGKPVPQNSLFGAATQAFMQAPPSPGVTTGGILFGSQPALQQPASFSFGSQPQPQQQQSTGGLFGSAQPSTGGFFGSAGTQGASAASPSSPATPIQGVSLFGSSTAVASGSAPTTSIEDEFEEIAPIDESPVEERGGGDARSDERKTVVQESALSTSFRVEGKASVPSDGLPHQVLVAVIPFEAALTYVAVPRAEAAAYVQCEVKNTSEYRLLPGPISVFLDESFVSKTTVQEVNTSDTFECTLGIDPLVGVTYSRTVRSGKVEGGSFSEKTRTVYYTTTAAIKNRHRFALPRVVVRDSIPLSGRPNAFEDEDHDDTSVDRLRVILRKPLGLADAKDDEKVKVDANGAEDVVVRWMKKNTNGSGGEKHGKFEWLAKVDSGATVELKLEYEIKGGAETKWALRTTDK